MYERFKQLRGGSLVIPPYSPEPEPVPSVLNKHTNTHLESGNTQTDDILKLLMLPHIWTTPTDSVGITNTCGNYSQMNQTQEHTSHTMHSNSSDAKLCISDTSNSNSYRGLVPSKVIRRNMVHGGMFKNVDKTGTTSSTTNANSTTGVCDNNEIDIDDF